MAEEKLIFPHAPSTFLDEEIHLVRYFGDAYINFRKRTGHWLPVITTYAAPKPRHTVPGTASHTENGQKTQ